MPLDEVLQSLRRYCESMPPVAAMGVGVSGYDGERLTLHAPLAANVNDKGTAFGGSLTSLMTVAGWGLVTLQLQLRNLSAEVYVADSAIRYLAPLRDDLLAHARLGEGESWDDFFATLAARGRARVQIEAEVPLPDGGAATTLSGRFVAIARK